MNPQQLHDYIIKPTLEYMGGNYYSKGSAFLLLCTAAIESNCGEYIKQINGPAIGIWQMEPATYADIQLESDALIGNSDFDIEFQERINSLETGFFSAEVTAWNTSLIQSPMYACAMARLKYSMDPHPLPEYTGDISIDMPSFYEYYKRVYNTELGASTYQKWCNSIAANHIAKVKL